MSKSKKKKEAIRKAKRKKIIITVIICIIAAAILTAAIILIVNNERQNTDRVFVSHGAEVTLSGDGTFNAFLWHNEIITGTYTESEENGVLIVAFMNNGVTEMGLINGNMLYIPHEWDDDHGHGNEAVFTLR